MGDAAAFSGHHHPLFKAKGFAQPVDRRLPIPITQARNDSPALSPLHTVDHALSPFRFVMPGRSAGHPRIRPHEKTWMAGSSPAMTSGANTLHVGPFTFPTWAYSMPRRNPSATGSVRIYQP